MYFLSELDLNSGPLFLRKRSNIATPYLLSTELWAADKKALSLCGDATSSCPGS